MFKDIRAVFSQLEISNQVRWYEAALLALTLAGCGFTLLWLGYWQ